jgi:enamine deaminase RidA (YjgF/YER057c/UK114 family)
MSSKISAVSTKKAPAALSVYSQAIVANGFVYCSGSPINAKSKKQVKSPPTHPAPSSTAILKLIP